jgi:hypothetical protein
MQLSSDRTGFPVAQIEQIGLAFNLLPVTKVQFEQFLSEPRGNSDLWYEKVLEVSPRTSWRRITESERPGLFMTGILPHEVSWFGQWLGEDFALPDITQWRQIDHWACHTRYNGNLWKNAGMSLAARYMLEEMEQQLQPQTWSEIMMLHGERRDAIGNWVQWQDEDHRDVNYGVLGRVPRSVGNPQKHPPFLPPSPQYRDVRYGFRLMQL